MTTYTTADNGNTDNATRSAMMCELYILRKCGVERTESDWMRQAGEHGWLNDGSQMLHNVGRMLERECFSLRRTFGNTPDDICAALQRGEHVIAIVDGKELTKTTSDMEWERLEDESIGKNPNHAIVIESYDIERMKITYYDPAVGDGVQTLSTAQFEDAWDDSNNYLARVSQRNLLDYTPRPIDLSDIDLPGNIEDLCEAIAENAHETWAARRKAEGWRYGADHDSLLKTTPDMVPYSELTEAEKQYDRDMAISTIKLLKKLGYRIVRE